MPKKVEIIEITKNDKPNYIQTMLIKAKREDDKEIIWEMVKSRGSVHILVDNIETKELLLVKQVRIPVLFNDDSKNGVVYEMCAGIIDKDKSLIEIAKEEVLEELGYDVPLENIQFIKTLKSSVGNSGASANVFHAKVNESFKINEGGGVSDEDIKIVRIPYNEIFNFLNEDIHTDAMTQYLLYYWLHHNK